MDELGEDARGLLEAFRAEERPSSSRRQAIWSELETTRGAERPRRKIRPIARDRASRPTPVVSRASAARWLPVAALAAAAALVLVWSRWAAIDREQTDPAVSIEPSQAVHQLDARQVEGVVAPSARAAPSTRGEIASDLPEEQPAVETEGATTPDARAKGRSGARDAAIDELETIERAQRALRDGHADRALELLELHRRSHREGALAEERELLRAQALCAVGRLDESRALAAEFVAAHPGSAYAGKMRRVCVQRPSRGLSEGR